VVISAGPQRVDPAALVRQSIASASTAFHIDPVEKVVDTARAGTLSGNAPPSGARRGNVLPASGLGRRRRRPCFASYHSVFDFIRHVPVIALGAAALIGVAAQHARRVQAKVSSHRFDEESS
jgi:hypothetical protein